MGDWYETWDRERPSGDDDFEKALLEAMCQSIVEDEKTSVSRWLWCRIGL